MPAPTLVELAQRQAVRYPAGVHSVGDLPWELVKPIIQRIEVPQQLHTIEQASPQIIGYDEECWLSFMKRDIPRYETRPHRPSDPANWHKAYRKLKKEVDTEMAAGTDRLRAAFASIKEEKEQNLAKLTTRVDTSVVKRPSSGWSNRGNWAPSTKHMSAAERIKRNQADAQRARLLRERNQIKLGRQLKSTATPQNFTKVAVAPRSMIEEVKKRKASPPPEPRIIRAPVRRGYLSKPPMHGPKDEDRRRPKEAGAGYDLISDREARLRAMQTKNYDHPVAVAMKHNDAGGLSLDFLEDDELFSEDDDTTAKPATTPQKTAPQRLAPSAAGLSTGAPPHRAVSPRPLPAKRKTPPSLFMTSKRPRAGMT